MPESIESDANFLQIAEKTETLSKKSDEAIKNNLSFLAAKFRNFVSSSKRTPTAIESKSADFQATQSSSKEEENKLEAVVIGPNTAPDEIRFPEVQEFKCGVLDDQTTAKRLSNDPAADENVLKKPKYDFKYESKLEYRNYK